MQAPPASVPFVEYVLKAIEHPPFMFVSKLAACCTMLFLTRSDPELLRTLCFKWAIRFQMDRKKLIGIIRRRSRICRAEDAAGSVSDDDSDDVDVDKFPCALQEDGSQISTESPGDDVNQGHGDKEEYAMRKETSRGLRLCNPDEAVEHFLKILNSLVPMYFSWNWHRTDYVIQINKEYEAYVRENILPICIAMPAEEGLDDEEQTPWLLSPNEYLSGGSASVSNFYSPVTSKEPPAHLPRHGEAPHGLLANQETLHIRTPRSGDDPESSETQHAGGAASTHHFGEGSVLTCSPRFAVGEDATIMPPGTQRAANRRTASTALTPGSPQGTAASSMVEKPPASTLLSFLTLANFREALDANTHGLVIIFHAKYSAKSNEMLEVFQEILRQDLLHPMPDVAVIYTVAEPELAALYNVSWFPTVIYTPPKRREMLLTTGGTTPLIVPNDNQHKGDAQSAHSRLSTPAKPEATTQRDPPITSTPVGIHSNTTPSKHLSATSPYASTDDMGNLTNGDGAGSLSRGGNTLLSSSVGSRRAPSTVPAVNLPVGPSPTQVLYGFSVEKEKPSASPMGTKLSPTGRTVQPLQSAASTAASPVVATPLTQVSGEAKSPVSAIPQGTVSSTSSSHHVPCALMPAGPGDLATGRLAHSPSSSTFSLFADPCVDGTTEELMQYIANDGHKVFPINGVVSVASLVEWVSSKGQAPPKIQKIKDFVTRVSALRAEQKYKKFRELHSAVVMLRRLQNGGAKDTCASSAGRERGGAPDSGTAGTGAGRRVIGRHSARPADPSLVEKRTSLPLQDTALTTSLEGASKPSVSATEPPLFIFLGGGMAAGKSTAAMALAHSAWWRNHKDQSVLVNADEFKVTEPAFDGLQAEVHTKSTRAAESLLVQAVNQGRSIVFDGTMMWAPFVLQVIDMVRNAHIKLYKQGAGYRGPGKPEEYFLPSEVRPTPLPHPYVIRFLGITVEPEIAVPRGFLRKFSTGRGVPISTQLRSFKMFAENFPMYASLVDSATLYNNNVFVDLDKGELPPVMAERDSEKQEGQLRVFDEAAYQLFMKQTTLNEDADNILELYPAVSPTSTVFPMESNGNPE